MMTMAARRERERWCGLEDTVVHDQEDTLSEQGEAIENDVVIEEQEEQAHTELTRKRKLKKSNEIFRRK